MYNLSKQDWCALWVPEHDVSQQHASMLKEGLNLDTSRAARRQPAVDFSQPFYVILGSRKYMEE